MRRDVSLKYRSLTVHAGAKFKTVGGAVRRADERLTVGARQPPIDQDGAGRDVEDPILYPHDGVGETERRSGLPCARIQLERWNRCNVGRDYNGELAKAAASDELRDAFASHLEETRGQVTRLEEKSIMEEDFEKATMDACLIAAGQRAEHYEMAASALMRSRSAEGFPAAR